MGVLRERWTPAGLCWCPGVFLGDEGEKGHMRPHFKGGARTGWLQLGDKRNPPKAQHSISSAFTSVTVWASETDNGDMISCLTGRDGAGDSSDRL